MSQPGSGWRHVPLRIVVALVAVLSVPAFAQTAAPAGTEVTQLLTQLGEAKWAQRSKAFYRLLKLGSDSADAAASAPVAGLLRKHPHKADEVKVALAKTLATENRLVGSAASLPESFTDYYGDLIAAVASLNDPRSAEALAGALGHGQMVTSALAGLGDAAVDPVIARLQPGADRTVRVSACRVLQSMVDPTTRTPIKDAQHKRRIEQALAGRACEEKKD